MNSMHQPLSLNELQALLGREHPDAAAIVGRALRRDGVEVLLESKAKSVERKGTATSLLVETAQGERNLAVDARQRLQVLRQEHADHASACTSTDSTLGRSRTIGVQESPPSAEP